MLSGPIQEIVGVSPPIQKLRLLLKKVSASTAHVLLLGASGTGKEVVARSIHHHSDRASKPFVALNCGAIPADLLESELFGHEKGSFTGATQTRIGRFEQANGGTLFLDEIGDMPLAMQVKMLRVLETKTFERVGGRLSIETNVRIIAATHRHLDEAIKIGAFREDLYYRLNVLPIQMPLLKDRPEDIPLLIQYLLSHITPDGAERIQFNQEAEDVLRQYYWPGNIRELHNLLERLTLLYPGQVINLPLLPEPYNLVSALEVSASIMPAQAGSMGQFTAVSFDLKKHLEGIERQYIEEALLSSRYVISQAANTLGLRRTTLVEKMKKYAISKERQ
jgi:sigma-54 specific flagellar transcriptional regulator A